jgi:hypothetical protein
MRSAIVLLGIFIAACGTDNRTVDGPRVTLVASEVGIGEGLDLATFSITDETASRGSVDFCLGWAMVISLRGKHDEMFCQKGRDYARIEDIPTDLDGCPAAYGMMWSSIAYLSGSARHTLEDSYVAGDGYLVRDRAGDKLYRMLVVGDAFDSEGAVVVLEIAPVP